MIQEIKLETQVMAQNHCLGQRAKGVRTLLHKYLPVLSPASPIFPDTKTEDLSRAREICDFAMFATLRRVHLSTRPTQKWLFGLGTFSFIQVLWSSSNIVEHFNHFSGIRGAIVSAPAFLSVAFALSQLTFLPWAGYKISKEITDCYQTSKEKMIERYTGREILEVFPKIDMGACQAIRSGKLGRDEAVDFSVAENEIEIIDREISDFGKLLALKRLAAQIDNTTSRARELIISAILLPLVVLAFLIHIPQMLIGEAGDYSMRALGYCIGAISFFITSFAVLVKQVNNPLTSNIQMKYNSLCQGNSFGEYMTRTAPLPPVLGELDEGEYQRLVALYEDGQEWRKYLGRHL